MKLLMLLTTILLLVACATTPTSEEKVVGEYESIYNGKTYKRVFKENGIVEWYVNGRKRAEYKLEIVNGEIRAAFGSEYNDIYRLVCCYLP